LKEGLFYKTEIISCPAVNRIDQELSIRISRKGQVLTEVNAGLQIWTLLTQGEYWFKQGLLAEIGIR